MTDFSVITFFPFSMYDAVLCCLIVVLLFISAMVSASEVSFFLLSPANIFHLKSKKTKPARTAIRLLNQPKQLLACILITNNTVNVGIVIVSTHLVNRLIDFSLTPGLGFLIQVICISAVLLLFGEILPKVFASHKPVRLVLMLSVPLHIIYRIEKPLVNMLVQSTNIIDKRIQKKSSLSMGDLSNALDLTTGGTVEERGILKGIVELGTTEVNDILTARLDIMALDLKTPFKKVLQTIVDSGYSRIPVYATNFDDIKGVLYIKDILPHIHKPDFKWQSLIRPPYFVPEKKKINDLLHEFQAKKIHMAVVIDEYGGTKGIVTLEDILEQIVGEISDEFDEEEVFYSRIDANTYIFKGKTLLHDFYKITGTNPEMMEEKRGEADTLAGFILEISGVIPQPNETIYFNNLVFKIEEVDNRRIKKIKTIINP